MTPPALRRFSDDQAEAYDRVADALRGGRRPRAERDSARRARARTRCWRSSARRARARRCCWRGWPRRWTRPGSRPSRGDWEGRRRRDRRTLAILAPTNKAASVLRTARRAGDDDPPHPLHPGLRPRIREDRRMAGRATATRPEIEGADRRGARPGAGVLRRRTSRSPARWRRRGCAGRTSSTAGSGATTRSTSASSTRPRCSTTRQFEDLREIFPTLVLFGDPAQLAPVNQSGAMVFDGLPDDAQADAAAASTGRRRTTRSSTSPMRWPTPSSTFEDFERMVEEARRDDDRVVVGAAGRGRPDGALAGAGLAQRDAHPADPGLPRGPRRARRRAAAGRAADLRRDRAAAQAPQEAASTWRRAA